MLRYVCHPELVSGSHTKSAFINLYYIYILTNAYRKTFYIGVTNDLNKRVSQHNIRLVLFLQPNTITDLIYYETFEDINKATSIEKQLKNWKKEWKLNLIKLKNPTLETLSIL